MRMYGCLHPWIMPNTVDIPSHVTKHANATRRTACHVLCYATAVPGNRRWWGDAPLEQKLRHAFDVDDTPCLRHNRRCVRCHVYRVHVLMCAYNAVDRWLRRVYICSLIIVATQWPCDTERYATRDRNHVDGCMRCRARWWSVKTREQRGHEDINFINTQTESGRYQTGDHSSRFGFGILLCGLSTGIVVRCGILAIGSVELRQLRSRVGCSGCAIMLCCGVSSL